jgi:F0F1-type ATP synthase epsilon subunit
MRFELISINGKVLETEDFISATIPTHDGQIMVLPNHEPIMCAIVPGVFAITYGRKRIYTPNFVIGGGVLHVTPDTCRIIADLVENEDNLTDEEYILTQKKEAEELKNAFILE